MNLRHLLGLLSLAGFTAAAAAFAPAPAFKEPPRPKTPALVAALEGTWEIEQTRINRAINGRVVAGGRIGTTARRKVRIHNGQWTYVFVTNGVERESTRYAISLDAKQAPAALDLKYQNQNVVFVGGGPAGGVRQVVQTERVAMRGIVKVEGDTATFSYYPSGGLNSADRPRDFESNANSSDGMPTYVMILKRVK